MNVNQEAIQDASASLPEKRKRGRPRKYPKLISDDNTRSPKIQKTSWAENSAGGGASGGPPGYGSGNGNQPRPVAASCNTANSMVGRTVFGVIEGVFDAGYLLNVRVSHSDTTLRGVVFRPGRFVPVGPENDMAPSVQMIRRNDVPLPTEHRELNPSEKHLNQAPPHPDPVAHASDPSPLLAQQASKGKQLQEDPSFPSNGSISATQVPIFNSEANLSQQQNEKGLCNQIFVESLEAKSTELPAMAKDQAAMEDEEETNSGDQALDIEPLQAVLFSDPKPVKDDTRTSKMTQLLEVLQGPVSESSGAEGFRAEVERNPEFGDLAGR